jgi:hypothetical protein
MPAKLIIIIFAYKSRFTTIIGTFEAFFPVIVTDIKSFITIRIA